MWSPRLFVGWLTSLALLLALAATILTAVLSDQRQPPSCYIGLETDHNEWLCIYVYASTGATFIAMIALAFFMCGKLWFRGGCYKFFQLLLLLVPTVVWGVAGFFVTAAGVGMNTPYVNTVSWWLRTALMGVTLGTFAALAIATLVRALVKPGKIKQAELDLMEAERRAQRDLKRMRGLWGDPRLRAYNGTKRAMQAQMRHHMAQARREYGGGYVRDGKSADDEIYMPRHPRWYGQFLLPNEVDLSRWPIMPSVLDQGTMGSCCAHAATNAFRFALVKEAQQSQAFMPSRMFIWYHAKEAYKPGTGTMNEGCTLRACFKQVQLKGACDETLFPYSWNYLPYPPSDACIADAKRHQKKLRPIKLLPSHSLEPLVKRYGKPAVQARYSDSTYACLLSPNEKLYTIMAALARGHPIACALVIPDHFNDLNNEEYPGPVLDYPAEGVRIDLENGWGGHAVLLVGYNKKHGWFKFQNSWGTNWGARGYFYTPIEYAVDSRLARDFWFFND